MERKDYAFLDGGGEAEREVGSMEKNDLGLGEVS